jgi:hypothetical protein
VASSGVAGTWTLTCKTQGFGGTLQDWGLRTLP